MRNKLNYNLLFGFVLLGFITLLIAYSYLGSDRTANQMEVGSRFLAPSLNHFLGTDNFGRDILVRIVTAFWKSIKVAVFTVAIGASIGFLFGAVAGWFGGSIDELIMRGCDILTAFPGLLLALVLISVLGSGDFNIVIALGIIFIPSYARLTRSCYIRIKEAEYISSAKMAGCSTPRIILVHIFPNITTELLSSVTVGFANAILSEAALSFLGLGIQPPDPSLGRMLSEAQSYLFKAPWMSVAPGVTIIIVVLTFNYLSEGIKQKYRR